MFDWEKAIALDKMQTESGLISQGGESLMGFLDLRPEPGVYSRVTVGCPFETGVCSVKSGHLSRYEGHLRNVNYGWKDNTDAS